MVRDLQILREIFMVGKIEGLKNRSMANQVIGRVFGRIREMLGWRKFKFILTIIIIINLYALANLHNWAWYNRPTSHVCKTPEKEMTDLISLTHDTRNILESFNLTNFLIYGSLWGALRYKAPLPWDNDFDMGLVSSELTPDVERAIFEAFNKQNIKIYYRYWFGTYRVTRASARGDLMVFRENLFGNCVRLGIESWVFFINYRKHHTFPCTFIAKPLPNNQFAGLDLKVPRGGKEIQKHFYPDDWWKESKPSGCK